MHKDGRGLLFTNWNVRLFDGRENGGFHTSHAQGIMVGTDPLINNNDNDDNNNNNNINNQYYYY